VGQPERVRKRETFLSSRAIAPDLIKSMSKAAGLSRSSRWPDTHDHRNIVVNSAPVSGDPLNNKGTTILQDTVSWPHPECELYLKTLEGQFNLESWEIPKGSDYTLYRHVCRLRDTLVFWSQLNPEGGIIGNPYGILYENLKLGPELADQLDDQLKYGTRLHSSLALNYGKESYPLFCRDVKDWDQVFSPYHLIPFVRHETNDIDLLFQEPVPVEEELLDKFREIVREHIKRPFEPKRTLDDIDLLGNTGSATSFDPFHNRRETKTYSVLKSKGEFRKTSSFTYDYVKVDKSPHESRACVVPTLDTLQTVKLLELQMQQVISCKWDKIREKDFDFLPDYLSVYSKKLYILSDQKKCGLTFPRILLKILYNVLQEEFPDWDFNLIEGLSNQQVKGLDGKMHQALGGPGLGQFNASISLVVALLFELWRRDQDQDLHLDGLFYNDDQVIRFTFLEARMEPLPEWVSDLALSWDMFMESYGLHVHKKKPFISDGGVFLEVYGNGFRTTTKKICQKVGNIFHCLCSSNIVEAKEYFSSVYDTLEHEMQIMAMNILKARIVPQWGHEFYPQEIFLPKQFGGWVRSFTIEGLDNLFNCVDQLPVHMQGLINLPFVRKPNKQGSKEKKCKHLISKVSNTVKDTSNGICPTKFDYSKMVESSLHGFRLNHKEHFQLCKAHMKLRQEAVRKRPMTYNEFFNKYWELVIEDGKAYAPPFFATLQNQNWVPFGDSLVTGKPVYKDDPIRIFSKIRQEVGQLSNYFRFWTVCPSENINSMMYSLVSSLDIKNIRITPNTVTLAMLLGEANLEKILWYSHRVSGNFGLPEPPFDILTELGLSNRSKVNNYIYLDHTSQFCWITDCDASLEPELFRIQNELVTVLNNALANELIDGEDFFSITNYDQLGELLSNDRHCIFKQKARIAVDEPPMEIPEEDRSLLAYLIYQVRAPEHTSAVEEALRSGLAGQIYGQPDDMEETLSEGDLFEMFGD
jgi:hypothetical protein